MSGLPGFLSRESLSLNTLSSRYWNWSNTQFKSSTDLNLYFQQRRLFSANNGNTCYGFKLEFFIWNLWIWGYSGKCPEKKSCQGLSKQLHNPLFIWGVDPAIHSMFAVVSSAELVARATVIPEQSQLHWWSVTTCFVLLVSCNRLNGDTENKHL